jgi:integrase
VQSKSLADLADLHLLALAAEHASPATVTLYRHVLGLFRGWLSDALGRAPTVAHMTPAEPRVITSDELARLVAACTLTLQPMRNRAIIALLADSGIRVSGLCGLDVGDVTMPAPRQDHGSAHIRLKGGDHRSFPFGRKTAQALRNYTVLERGGAAVGPLFLGRAGQRVTVKMIERMLREVTTNPHGLRHYAGTSWAAQGLNALQVRDRLGHKSLETSLRYVHLAQREQGYRSALDEAEVVNPRLFREHGA